jgi:hypothetical protein
MGIRYFLGNTGQLDVNNICANFVCDEDMPNCTYETHCKLFQISSFGFTSSTWTSPSYKTIGRDIPPHKEPISPNKIRGDIKSLKHARETTSTPDNSTNGDAPAPAKIKASIPRQGIYGFFSEDGYDENTDMTDVSATPNGT